jgi:hypothetical protein
MLALLTPSLRSPERTRPQHLRQMCHRVSAYVRMRLADERIARSDAKGFKLEVVQGAKDRHFSGCSFAG